MTTPTLDTVMQSYVTYAGYDASGSVSDCQSFVTACRQLLLLLPSSSQGPMGTTVEFQVAEVRRAMQDAQAWLGSHQSDSQLTANPTVLHHDFGEFTDRA